MVGGEEGSVEQPGTITRIIRELEGAESRQRDFAVRELWERFFADLTTSARKRLRAMNTPVGPADEEDAASRAFTKVCRGIERGQLRLANRVDLARVLRSATAREVLTLRNRAGRPGGPSEGSTSGIPDPSLPPDLLLLAFDACQRLLGLLETDNHRQVAVWKLAGHTNEAIAVSLSCSTATVERTLGRIRETWRQKWVDAVPHGPAKSGPRRGTSEAINPAVQEPAAPASIDPEDENRLLRELAGLS
jgi:DNA-directed RNA polymerase specialized sigma24 family protein